MKVLVLPDGELYVRAAESFVETARQAVQQKGLFAVALSGGSTPRTLYELLAEQYAGNIDWPHTHIFFSDERCVPPDDPDSNYRMAHQSLLSKVQVLPENIHRMRGEDEPQKAAQEYEAELAQVFRNSEAPRLDLLLLGIGEDCHTASIFPGSEVLQGTNRLVAALFVPKLDTHRLTLTPPALQNASLTIILATGANKAEAVKRAIEGPYEVESCPAQLLRGSRGEVLWMLDQEAATGLSADNLGSES